LRQNKIRLRRLDAGALPQNNDTIFSSCGMPRCIRLTFAAHEKNALISQQLAKFRLPAAAF
jgi:hypothetical protein